MKNVIIITAIFLAACSTSQKKDTSSHSTLNITTERINQYNQEHTEVPRIEIPLMDGVAEGVAKEYNRDGTLLATQQFKNGYKNGSGKLYDTSGRLRAEFNYKNGLLDGELIEHFFGNPPRRTILEDGIIITEKNKESQKAIKSSVGKAVLFTPTIKAFYCGSVTYTEEHSYADSAILNIKSNKLHLIRREDDGKEYKTIYEGEIPTNNTEARLSNIYYNNENRRDPNILIRIFELKKNKLFRIIIYQSNVKVPIRFQAPLSALPEYLYSLDFGEDFPGYGSIYTVLDCNLKKLIEK